MQDSQGSACRPSGSENFHVAPRSAAATGPHFGEPQASNAGCETRCDVTLSLSKAAGLNSPAVHPLRQEYFEFEAPVGDTQQGCLTNNKL